MSIMRLKEFCDYVQLPTDEEDTSLSIKQSKKWHSYHQRQLSCCGTLILSLMLLISVLFNAAILVFGYGSNATNDDCKSVYGFCSQIYAEINELTLVQQTSPGVP